MTNDQVMTTADRAYFEAIEDGADEALAAEIAATVEDLCDEIGCS